MSRQFPEDTTYVFSATDFSFTDVDGGTISGVTFTSLPTGARSIAMPMAPAATTGCDLRRI